MSTLPEHLARQLAETAEAPLCVAFSGGPDSSALLHALAALQPALERSLRAVHVDHRLHPDSADWARHCARMCATLDVPLQILEVDVHDDGHGLEAAARSARYAAIAEHLQPHELVVTAHHLDDQAETVLLKLLRGAGPEGLGAMRAQRALGSGGLWRPLLDLPRAVLHAYVREHALDCIDDPSNRALQQARGFLRSDILPRLHRHWPQAEQTLGHVAQLHADAADFIRQHALDAFTALYRDGDASLDAADWLGLHPALRGVLLEHWLHARGLPAPARAQRDELERQLHQAAPDRIPEITWPGVRLRCWRGRLYAHASDQQAPSSWHARWHGEPLALPGGGTLRMQAAATTDALPELEVRLGQRGVHLKPHDDTHTRALRSLFQQAALPPWQRRACPLIHALDGTLLAVADLWLTDAGARLFEACKVQLCWQRMR